MTGAQTYTEAVQLQCDIMLKVAKRLDERGYAVIVHWLNPDAKHEKHPYGLFLGALDRFAKDWAKHWSAGKARAEVKRPVFINIWSQQRSYVKGKGCIIPDDARECLLERPFSFSCRLPWRDRYKSIHAALELMSVQHNTTKNIVTGTGCLIGAFSEHGDFVEYRGNKKEQLEILLRVLDMPHHREMLRGGKIHAEL